MEFRSWNSWREFQLHTSEGLEELYDQMWRTILARRPGRPGPPADRTLRPDDPRLAAYEPIVGLEAGGARRAYPLDGAAFFSSTDVYRGFR